MRTSIPRLLKEVYWPLLALMIAIIGGLQLAWSLVLWFASPDTDKKYEYLASAPQFPWQVWLVLGAGGIVLITLIGAFRSIRTRERVRQEVQELALLIRRGHELKDRTADTHRDLPSEEFETWAMDAKSLLENLGGNYLDSYTKTT